MATKRTDRAQREENKATGKSEWSKWELIDVDILVLGIFVHLIEFTPVIQGSLCLLYEFYQNQWIISITL